MKKTLIVLSCAFLSFPALARGLNSGPERNSQNSFWSTSRVLSLAEQYRGSRNITGTSGPWCRDFVNFILERSGYTLLDHSRRAIDALNLGSRTYPHPGAIVVMRGHTGIYVEDAGQYIKIISGNWNNRVDYGMVPKYSVVAYVDPK